jgi:hypothetical protein
MVPMTCHDGEYCNETGNLGGKMSCYFRVWFTFSVNVLWEINSMRIGVEEGPFIEHCASMGSLGI